MPWIGTPATIASCTSVQMYSNHFGRSAASMPVSEMYIGRP